MMLVNRTGRVAVLWLAVAGLGESKSLAELRVIFDKSVFLEVTNAVPETEIPCTGGCTCTNKRIGDLVFTATPACDGFDRLMSFGDAAPAMAGCEIATNGCEHLDVVAVQGETPVQRLIHALGFDFFEPTSGGGITPPGCEFSDSWFTVAVKNGSTTVGTFHFNAPNDVPAFVGVWSSEPFDRLEIREDAAQCEDDYYGSFYSSDQSVLNINVPAVSEWGLAAMALLVLSAGTIGMRRVISSA